MATPLLAQQDFLKQPTIELSYGAPSLSLKDAPAKLSSVYQFGFNWGLRRLRTTTAPNILDYTRPSLTFSVSPKENSTGNDELATSFWRFGVAVEDGYAYKLTNRSILSLSCNSGLSWTKVDIASNPQMGFLSENYQRFDGKIHFGTVTQAGVNMQIGHVIFGANMERALMFPAHLFLQSTVSYLIQMEAHQLAGKLTDCVFECAPKLVPVVDFLLKNGINFTMYELRRNNMNWPFSSEKPLLNKAFNVYFSLLF
ncbi:hypothetical protein [Chloroherpeton thalassium]|nr:hypothetical protein [Chloroherpeton thalassium]